LLIGAKTRRDIIGIICSSDDLFLDHFFFAISKKMQEASLILDAVDVEENNFSSISNSQQFNNT
jgi:hypothetical protein